MNGMNFTLGLWWRGLKISYTFKTSIFIYITIFVIPQMTKYLYTLFALFEYYNKHYRNNIQNTSITIKQGI